MQAEQGTIPATTASGTQEPVVVALLFDEYATGLRMNLVPNGLAFESHPDLNMPPMVRAGKGLPGDLGVDPSGSGRRFLLANRFPRDATIGLQAFILIVRLGRSACIRKKGPARISAEAEILCVESLRW